MRVGELKVKMKIEHYDCSSPASKPNGKLESMLSTLIPTQVPRYRLKRQRRGARGGESNQNWLKTTMGPIMHPVPAFKECRLSRQLETLLHDFITVWSGANRDGNRLFARQKHCGTGAVVEHLTKVYKAGKVSTRRNYMSIPSTIVHWQLTARTARMLCLKTVK